eukprot:TRINITY_DN14083_c0_g1_i1.p1 TRINITY_DN14083_c0_g1~~TRINITY_DN14083_c0_g1_i1.p1  ORF type:complete len:1203 (-),score=249.93 TRINITY_DN14083_c0_g1_i1:131-3739(-)
MLAAVERDETGTPPDTFWKRCQLSDGCHFCRRVWDDDLVQRRRPRAAICRSCDRVLFQSFPVENERRIEYKEELQRNVGAFRKFATAVLVFEARQGKNSAYTHVETMSKNMDVDDDNVADTGIDLFHNKKLEFRRKVGIFWPLKMYRKRFNRKAPMKNRLTDEDGAVGLILDSKYGCPDGCSEVISVTNTGVVKRDMVNRRSKNIHPNETEDIWAGARKRSRISAKPFVHKSKKPGENDLEGVTLTIASHSKATSSDTPEDGSTSLFNSLWAASGLEEEGDDDEDDGVEENTMSCAEGSEPPSKRKLKLKRRLGRRSSRTAAAPKAKINAGASSSTPVNRAKLRSIAQTTERVVQRVRGFAMQLAGQYTVVRVKVARLNELGSAIEKRLSDELCDAYVQMGEGGVKLMHEARRSKELITSIYPIVHAVSDESSSADVLFDLVAKFKVDEVPLCKPALHELCVARKLEQAPLAGDFEGFAQVQCCNVEFPEKPMMRLLPIEQRLLVLQSSIITVVGKFLLKPFDTHFQGLMEYMSSVTFVHVVAPVDAEDFVNDFKSLRLIVNVVGNVASEPEENLADDIEEALGRVNAKTCSFCQYLSSPFGVALKSKAAALQLEMLKIEHCKDRFNALVEKVPDTSTVPIPTLRSKKEWLDFGKQFQAVCDEVGPTFLADSEKAPTAFFEAKAHLQRAANALIGWNTSQLKGLLDNCLTKDTWTDRAKGIKAIDNVEVCLAIDICTDSFDAVSFDGAGTKRIIEEHLAMVTNARSELDVLKVGFRALVQPEDGMVEYALNLSSLQAFMQMIFVVPPLVEGDDSQAVSSRLSLCCDKRFPAVVAELRSQGLSRLLAWLGQHSPGSATAFLNGFKAKNLWTTDFAISELDFAAVAVEEWKVACQRFREFVLPHLTKDDNKQVPIDSTESKRILVDVFVRLPDIVLCVYLAFVLSTDEQPVRVKCKRIDELAYQRAEMLKALEEMGPEADDKFLEGFDAFLDSKKKSLRQAVIDDMKRLVSEALSLLAKKPSLNTYIAKFEKETMTNATVIKCLQEGKHFLADSTVRQLTAIYPKVSAQISLVTSIKMTTCTSVEFETDFESECKRFIPANNIVDILTLVQAQTRVLPAGKSREELLAQCRAFLEPSAKSLPLSVATYLGIAMPAEEESVEKGEKSTSETTAVPIADGVSASVEKEEKPPPRDAPVAPLAGGAS